MERSLPAFCHRQSAKMLEFANHCSDPVLKDQFLKMSAYWLKIASAPSERSKQSTVKDTSSETTAH